ncbi:hypothetical protein [Pedobacter endophyticus]|uniref:Nucleotidyl transferase AbiEii toxin, Type IV TA system n=1 Tax=Pedobacter endophyticus TaxID=2789740 RepID=A0A7S9L281_9SPHI|nr:hypothetical protein [Pedobacter endophyticus]QPH41112.1 hypothetical protein IZT61_07580 [Pedobacter endophyticus]
MSNDNHNLIRIKVVFDALEELAQDIIFIGGATVSLYADRLTEEIRPTDDIDILIELLNYRDYGEVERKLFNKGFSNDIESGVICRYKVNGIIVDVMPTSDKILGFANRWYAKGFEMAIKTNIGDGYNIKIFDPVHFLASKIEAFKNRGNDDGRWSTDFEDIIYILNNRSTIWEEILSCDDELFDYIEGFFSDLIVNKYLDEWISVHLGYGEEERTAVIIGLLSDFILNSRCKQEKR